MQMQKHGKNTLQVIVYFVWHNVNEKALKNILR